MDYWAELLRFGENYEKSEFDEKSEKSEKNQVLEKIPVSGDFGEKTGF
jgi:hypothetical protein